MTPDQHSNSFSIGDRVLIEFCSALCLGHAPALAELFKRYPGCSLMDQSTRIFSEPSAKALWAHELARIFISTQGSGARGAVPQLGAQGYRRAGEPSLDSFESLITTSAFGPRDANATASILSIIEAHGGFGAPERSLALAHAAIANKDVECLAWLAERDLWRANNDAAYLPTSAAAAFSPESDYTIERLLRICDAGALVDAEGSLGITDFLAFGLHRSAMALGTRGFTPRLLLVGPSNRPASTPLCTYLISLSQQLFLADKDVASAASDAVKCLQWLAASGAEFAPKGSHFPEGSPWQESPGAAANFDPFCAAGLMMEPALLRHSSCRVGRASRDPLAAAVMAELLRLGANPNLTGQFLAAEVRNLELQHFNSANFHTALDLGADPSCNPGEILAIPAQWSAKPAQAIAWFDKLAALGADPRSVSSTCSQSGHPLASAVSHRAIAYASHALKAGVCPSWRSLRTGETLWHLLAEQETKAALSFARELANIPAAAAMVDLPLSVDTELVDGRLRGPTPLHLACVSLNLGHAKILLGLGANPNLQDAFGQSALHCAGRKFGAKARQKTAPLIELLMSHGADPSLLNSNGLTAAQAMAKRAPLDGLAILLSSRPQDLSSGDAASTAAQLAIARRGEQALSIVEEAVLRSHGSISPAAISPSKKPRL